MPTSTEVKGISFVGSTRGVGSKPRLWNLQNLGPVLYSTSAEAATTNRWPRNTTLMMVKNDKAVSSSRGSPNSLSRKVLRFFF